MSFTGKMVRINLNLPEDMLGVLKERKRQVGIPVNRQIQRDIEAGIMQRAQDKVREQQKAHIPAWVGNAPEMADLDDADK